MSTEKKGVWSLQQVRDQLLAGVWNYQTDGFDTGELWSWGLNNQGQVGDNTVINRSSPVQIPGTDWCAATSSQGIKAALKNDNTLWIWGNNSTNGVLGLNGGTNMSSPTQIPGNVWCCVTLQAQAFRAAALKTDGTLWIWGCGCNGTLGLFNIINRSSPTQIPGTNWSQVAIHQCASAAIKSDGTLWSWGFGLFVGIGDIASATRSSPTQIPGTNWLCIAAAHNQMMAALKTDNTLWAWGNCIGDNTTIGRFSPTQIPGSWCYVESLNFTTGASAVAKKTDNTVWTWGFNTNGELGLNNVINRSSPTQLPGDSWLSVEAGHGTKSDGTFWTWGSNSGGELGLNNVINRSSPTQLPGTKWRCCNNSNRTIAIKRI